MATMHVSAPKGVPFVDVDREFDAPRELLFRAWTDPELVKQWLGPRRYQMEIETWESKDGGRYRYVHVDDHGHRHGFHGVFHGTPTIDRMVQTFEYEGAPGHVSLDALTLEDLGNGRTRARIHSTFQSVEARDGMVEHGMAEGMTDGFDRLDELLAHLKAPVGA